MSLKSQLSETKNTGQCRFKKGYPDKRLEED